MNITLPSIKIIDVIDDKIRTLTENLGEKNEEIYYRFRQNANNRYGIFFKRRLYTEGRDEFYARTRPLFFAHSEEQLWFSLTRETNKKIDRLREIKDICNRFPEVTLLEDEIRLIYS